MKDYKWRLVINKGGPGSGHWGHGGRPGRIGGSSPGQRLSYTGHNKPGAKPTPQIVNLSDADTAVYQDAMRLDTPEAKGMLDRAGGISREEALRRVDEAREAAAQEPSTRDKWVRDGEYLPERQRLHDEIEAELLGSGQSSDNPLLFLTGGLPGSGKSHMLKQSQYTDIKGKLVVIDSDNIKERLAKADGLKSLGYKAASYHAEADDIIASVFSQAISRNMSIGLDGTMKNQRKLSSLVSQFKSRGYRVEVAYASLPVKKAMTRAIGRYLEGGRFVDPAYIATHDNRNIKTAESLRGDVDIWRIWNTDVPFGSPALLIGEEINE